MFRRPLRSFVNATVTRPGICCMRRSVCIVGILASCIWSAMSAADELPRVGCYEIHEVALAAAGQYANPYTDLTADVSFAPPAGGQSRVVPMFWDVYASRKVSLFLGQLI